MNLYRKSERYLRLTERRLVRVKQQHSQLNQQQEALLQRIATVHERITVLEMACDLCDQSAQLSYDAFFDNRRQRAIALGEIARQLHQNEVQQEELRRLNLKKQELLIEIRGLQTKCEKFQTFLRRLRRQYRIQAECRAMNETEELMIYGRCKNGARD